MVEFQVYISTHHKGHFSFRLCDKVISPTTFNTAEEGQDCLDQHVLLRVPPEEAHGDCVANDARADCQPLDPKHPERWYLPPNTASGNVMKMWYYLPQGITCEKCTIQWYWATGNTCLYDADYVDYFMGTFPNAGWSGANSWSQFGSQSWGVNQVCGAATFGEEFWNCADVSIVAGDGSGGTPPSPAQPSPQPSPSSCDSCDGQCDWSRCSGCGVCSHKECQEWCSRAPVEWSEKCDWMYCGNCNECGLTAPSPTPQPTDGGDTGGSAADGFAAACRSNCGERTGTWKSDFTEFEGNDNFCKCGFGGSCGFICGGGVDGSSGGQCPSEACSSGQYAFEENTWMLTVDKSQAQGKNPYRAFAYLPLCQHTATINCAPDKDFTFAFSFRTTGLEGWGAYVKLLFWTDGGNLVGLIPTGSAAGKNKGFSKLTLVTFMQDDYPNNWQDQVEVQDGKWYSVQVRFHGDKVTVEVPGTGLSSTNENFGVNVWTEQNGPQLGVYHFDIGGDYTSDQLVLDLAALSGPGGDANRHDCEHGCLTEFATGTTRRRRTVATPTAAPPSSPATPAPTPPLGPSFCCTWSATNQCNNCESHNQQDASTWCGKSEGNCGTCNGIWCAR